MENKIIKLEHLHREFDKIVKVEWHLGLFCNNNCSYCSDTSHNDIFTFLDFNKFKIGSNNLIKMNKEMYIEFTGGEPTLNPYFIDMLKYLQKKNIHLSFTTNGHKNIEYYKRCIDLIHSITFSYHMEYNNFTPEMIIELQKYINTLNTKKYLKVHIMFLPGTLDKVKKLKKIFKDNNIRYAIRRIRPSYFRYHKDNEYWPDGRLKKGIIVPPFDTKSVSALLCTANNGTDHSESNQKYYSDEELKFLQENTKYNFNNLLIHYSDGTTKESNINEITGNKLNQFKGWVCYAGIQMLRIGEDGELTVGKCEQPPLGNIFGKFRIPIKPVICKNDWCCSATNINTTKYKDSNE